MNFSPESVNHRFITYSDSICAIKERVICLGYFLFIQQGQP